MDMRMFYTSLRKGENMPFKRVRVIHSPEELNEFYESVEQGRAISGHHVAHIPSPCYVTPSIVVMKYKGQNVIVIEIANDRYGVFAVPKSVTIHNDALDAEDEFFASDEGHKYLIRRRRKHDS
jgi:hypothetical protein